MKRYAIVRNADSRRQIDAYLPDNYKVIHERPRLGAAVSSDEVALDSRLDPSHFVGIFVIAGEDDHGWTLDGYVIPRCASGLIGVEEIDLSHPIMRSIPLEATNLEKKAIELDDRERALVATALDIAADTSADGGPEYLTLLERFEKQASRKPHVHVDQDRYLDVIDEVGGEALLEDVAQFFDVSETTARRNLDGLVAQGKLVVNDRCYALSDATINDPERGSG